jgi:glycosyltransferase involved in cell wall biosynthesis
VIVPALNEEATVASVVRAILDELDADVLVVDDGSSDRTAPIAVAAGAAVLQHPFNVGVGAALRSGFRYAAAKGYDRALQIDADGQHNPADAHRLLDRLARDSLDVVVGSRFANGYDTGRVRRLVMSLLAGTVSRRLGVPIDDTTSGYRAFGKRAVERFAVAYPSAYLSDTVEALLLCAEWDLRVGSEPVKMRERAGGTPSAGAAASVFHLLRLVLVVLLHRVRRPMTQRGTFDDVQA